MTTGLLKRLFTVVEFNRMVEAGILAEDDRLELIRGEIVQMSPIGSRHASVVNRLNRLFFETFGQRVLPSIQNPVEADDYSQPQPDVCLLRPREDFYQSGHPQPADVFLLVEVAYSTVKSDREIKIPLYAEDGIAEVWLVDINQDCLEVYRQPSAAGYQDRHVWQRGQTLSLLAFPEIEIAVSDVLG